MFHPYCSLSSTTDTLNDMMHSRRAEEPMPPYHFFIWTEQIIEHIAEHDDTPGEFEEVVNNPECEDISRSTGNPVAFGRTSAGRYPCCVFKRLGDDTIEPITAYDIGDE
jgi:hypothetical protein